MYPSFNRFFPTDIEDSRDVPFACACHGEHGGQQLSQGDHLAMSSHATLCVAIQARRDLKATLEAERERSKAREEAEASAEASRAQGKKSRAPYMDVSKLSQFRFSTIKVKDGASFAVR